MTGSATPSDAILERLLTLHPKLMDLTLGRTERLLDRLSNPVQSMPPVIHVAGTNGKGSTIAFVRAGIEAAGLSAHAYTSPHLARFHERIRLNGELIEEAALSALLEECETKNQGDQITFFEITTAAAYLAFARNEADYTLLEVGLGGRVDATNVIPKPRLTVITPVSIDHQQYLGDTLGEIAFEKAGILKSGVTCIVGPQENEALDVIERQAARVSAPLIVSGQDFTSTVEDARLIYRDEHGLLDMPLPALPGAHQIANAGTALAALRALNINDTAMEAAPGAAIWPGRVQRLTKGPLAEIAANADAELWLDGGHNAAAGEALAAHYAGLSPKRLHMIVAMLETKDPSGFLRPFAGFAEKLHSVPVSGTSMAYPLSTIADIANTAGIPSTISDSVEAALKAALTEGAERVLICGTLYLAGDVLRAGNG